jgi:hypothetical protein
VMQLGPQRRLFNHSAGTTLRYVHVHVYAYSTQLMQRAGFMFACDVWPVCTC